MADIVLSHIPIADMHVAVAGNLDQLVDEIIVARGKDSQRFFKQYHLLVAPDPRKDDDESGVDVEFGIFLQEVFSVVVTTT